MKLEKCPVCTSPDPTQIEFREDVPVFLNRFSKSLGEARATRRGILDVVGCTHCGFVWNRSFDPEKALYDSEYENDQTHSAAFRSHVDRMAQKILRAAEGIQPIDIVEVGCGQGALLLALAANAGPRLQSAIGFDPAFHNKAAITDSRIKVFGQIFDEKAVSLLERSPTLVVSRHTIEHVAEPISFLKAIRKAIGDTGARLFVETPDVRWIAARGEIEDLFYEHCSLFDQGSIDLALRIAGFVPTRIELVFEGQYLWAEAVPNISQDILLPTPANIHSLQSLASVREAFIVTWQTRIARGGPAVVWGAGAKGVSFCTLIDPDCSRIAALVDINPKKQKKFIPMTGHLVVDPASLIKLAPRTVIVMNPNYCDEITAMLEEMKLEVDIVVLGNELPLDCFIVPSEASD